MLLLNLVFLILQENNFIFKIRAYNSISLKIKEVEAMKGKLLVSAILAVFLLVATVFAAEMKLEKKVSVDGDKTVVEVSKESEEAGMKVSLDLKAVKEGTMVTDFDFSKEVEMADGSGFKVDLSASTAGDGTVTVDFKKEVTTADGETIVTEETREFADMMEAHAFIMEKLQGLIPQMISDFVHKSLGMTPMSM